VLRATYELDPPEAAEALAVQVSVGMAGGGAGLGARVAALGARVAALDGHRVVLEVPPATDPLDPDHVMAALVVGEATEVGVWRRCRLVALDLPAAAMPGPTRGAGPDRQVGVIVKPSLGLDPAGVAALVATAAGAGARVVKDDELLGDPPWCPLAARVEAVARVLPPATTYCANVSGEPTGLLDRARRAVDAGATGLMVNPFVHGLGALAALARAGLGVPILAHRVGSGPWVRNPAVGVAGHVLVSLCRWAGADLVIVGAFGGKLFETDDEVAANLHAARRPRPGVRPAWALLGGGLGPGDVGPQLARAGGSGLVVLLGSAAHRHPGGLGPAVAEAVAAVDAAAGR